MGNIIIMRQLINTRGTVLITGAAKRLGKAMALYLANKGFSIALHFYSSQREAILLQKQIQANGGSCTLFHCDLENEKILESLIPKVLKKHPDLRVLVNNASIFEKSTLQETDSVFFDRHFKINFKAPYFLTRDFAKFVDSGQVIQMLDTKITKNLFGYSAYTLSKKVFAEFTKMAALELAPRIRVNGICPGFILLPKGNSNLDTWVKNIPLQKKGSEEAVLNAVEFLMENDYITGQLVFVDGGQHLL
jgi:NAD(P)-dependent dehydrogenase (short-subunit alcohol dehydrogenase family)